jgi:hypothetical protein
LCKFRKASSFRTVVAAVIDIPHLIVAVICALLHHNRGVVRAVLLRRKESKGVDGTDSDCSASAPVVVTRIVSARISKPVGTRLKAGRTFATTAKRATGYHPERIDTEVLLHIFKKDMKGQNSIWTPLFNTWVRHFRSAEANSRSGRNFEFSRSFSISGRNFRTPCQTNSVILT